MFGPAATPPRAPRTTRDSAAGGGAGDSFLNENKLICDNIFITRLSYALCPPPSSLAASFGGEIRFVNTTLNQIASPRCRRRTVMRGGQAVTPRLFIPSENTVLLIPCLLSRGVIPLLPITPSSLPWPSSEEGVQGSLVCG